MRAVLDPNVIIAALLSPRGAPAHLLKRWENGEFELVASALLLEELERVLTYPKIRKRITFADAALTLAWLRQSAEVLPDPKFEPVVRSTDSNDDYLIILASHEDAFLVSGDNDLLSLRSKIPVLAPAEFFRNSDSTSL